MKQINVKIEPGMRVRINPDEYFITYAQWFGENDRAVAFDVIDDIKISTVFLGINHSFTQSGPPILFETMIFGGEHDEEQWRCSTWDQALMQHNEALSLASKH